MAKEFDPTPKVRIVKRISLPDAVMKGPLKKLHVRIMEKLQDAGFGTTRTSGVHSVQIEAKSYYGYGGSSGARYEIVIKDVETAADVDERRAKYEAQIVRNKAAAEKRRKDAAEYKKKVKAYAESQKAAQELGQYKAFKKLAKEYGWVKPKTKKKESK